MRTAASFLLAHFLVVLLAPAFVVVDFWVERDRIERELCVQRMVSGPQRTCHGQCYLMKQLERTEQRGKDMSTELRVFRLDDMAVEHAVPMLAFLPSADRPVWPALREGPRTGHPPVLEPVPWG